MEGAATAKPLSGDRSGDRRGLVARVGKPQLSQRLERKEGSPPETQPWDHVCNYGRFNSLQNLSSLGAVSVRKDGELNFHFKSSEDASGKPRRYRTWF